MNIYFDNESLSPYVTFAPAHYFFVAAGLVVAYLVFVTVVSESFSKTAAIAADNRKSSRKQRLWSGTKFSKVKYDQIGKEFERRKGPINFRTVDSIR